MLRPYEKPFDAVPRIPVPSKQFIVASITMVIPNCGKKIILSAPPYLLHRMNGLLLLLWRQDRDTRDLILGRWNKEVMAGLQRYVWPGRPCPEDIAIYAQLLHATAPKKILILGATPELRDLAQNFTKEYVTIVDLSLLMLKVMPAFLKNADITKEEWHFANWLSLPFPDHSYDTVLGDYVVKQVMPGERRRLVQEVGRVLVPNGSWILRNHYINPRWRAVPLEEITEKLTEHDMSLGDIQLTLLCRLYDRWVNPNDETFVFTAVDHDSKTLATNPPHALSRFPLFDAAAWIQKLIADVRLGQEQAKVNLSHRWSPTQDVFHALMTPLFRLTHSRHGSRGEDHEWSPVESFQKI